MNDGLPLLRHHPNRVCWGGFALEELCANAVRHGGGLAGLELVLEAGGGGLDSPSAATR
ncbi:hypothetical protein ACGFZS_14070 [Streptomyces sp. NPDC048288]|uniref:hypothetical protein n=1 Tax=Streptomyces sp. NPDC048288 TaxID=3365529 RepID=UPI00371C5600